VKLWAISDLHVGYEENRRAVEALEPMPDDWLIVAGDTGETPAHLDYVLKTLTPRFRQLVWTVGNHDLWTPRSLPTERRGVAHYDRLVRLCRSYGVLTPEDAYAVWPGDGPRTAIVPTFVLHDYSFRPNEIEQKDAVEWAAAAGVRCADEDLLDPSPYRSRPEWCEARIAYTRARLEAMPDDTRIILVNHWPLRYEHGQPPRIPRFSIWCGTRATETWHRDYSIDTVVYGHLHLRSSTRRDGVAFEEVSLGYPRQWNSDKPLTAYLRRIR
jgi:3',5'-cyclic AMP phosphodiesterase CpdA